MRAEPDVLLDVRELSVAYGRKGAQRVALHAASVSVRRGEAVGVIGETGSGKTTLARAVLGLVAPSQGCVRIGGEEVTRFSAREWQRFRRRGVVQYVFQDPRSSLDPDLSVGESIAEPLVVRGTLTRADIEAVVSDLLERLQLDPSLARRFPGELSGGQRQRVVLARALITEPELLLLDEPVSGLDPANRAQVLQILAGLRASGVSLLFISHDLGSIAKVTDRVLVLYRGSIVEAGTTASILERPQHPYSQLLVGSAPSLGSAGLSRARRDVLRAELAELPPASRTEARPGSPPDSHGREVR